MIVSVTSLLRPGEFSLPSCIRLKRKGSNQLLINLEGTVSTSVCKIDSVVKFPYFFKPIDNKVLDRVKFCLSQWVKGVEGGRGC